MGLKKLFNKEKLKGVMIGSIITILATSPLLIFAGSEAITAYLTDIKVLYNGKKVKSDTKPIIYNGRTFLPIRALADALDKNIDWNGETSTVSISDKVKKVEETVLTTKDIEDSKKNEVKVESANTTTPVKSDYVFRKVNWGMNKEQVVASEGKQPDEGSESSSLILYKTTIGNTDCDLFYEFNEAGQLCKISILGREVHTNENDFINDYDRIVKTLSTKYGNPIENETIWINDLYKDEPSKYGFAVSYGHLKYFSRWELEKTIVGGMLSGDNFKLGCYFFMQSKDIEQRKTDSGI